MNTDGSQKASTNCSRCTAILVFACLLSAHGENIVTAQGRQNNHLRFKDFCT